MSLLGVDVGTSAVKAVAFSEGGEVLGAGSAGYERRPGCDLENEQDAAVFWDAFAAAVQAASAATGKDRITAMAIAAHGETIIPIDKTARPCGPALLNRDHRSGPLIPSWEGRFGRTEVYRRTGLPLHAMYSLPKLDWLRRERPEVFGRASRFATVAGFLCLRLGLPHVVDYTLASRTMGFDIARLQWSEDLLGFAGISGDALGEALPSGTVIGRLDAERARALSLDPGVAVVLGGHDQPCGALGAGAVASGIAVDSAGSYECVTVVSEGPKNSQGALRFSLNSYPHVIAGRYVTLGFFPSGLVVDWMLERFFDHEPPGTAGARAGAERGVQELEPGPTSICLTPHLIGSINPHWDLRASLSITGIRAHHGRYHFYKALWEGIACELRENLRALVDVAGPISSLLIFGGGSQWDYGVQLRADISARSIQRLRDAQMVCRGAAILAGMGTGIYGSPEQAVASIVPSADVFSPRTDAVMLYAGQARRYAALYEGLGAYRSLDDSAGAPGPGARTETETRQQRR